MMESLLINLNKPNTHLFRPQMLDSWRFGLDRFRCTCTYHCSIFHNVQYDLNIQYCILHNLQLLRSTFLYIVCQILPYKLSLLSFGHNVQDKTLFIKKIQNQTNLQKKFEDKSKKEQTTQWPKEKVQKDKQRSTKHTKQSFR